MDFMTFFQLSGILFSAGFRGFELLPLIARSTDMGLLKTLIFSRNPSVLLIQKEFIGEILYGQSKLRPGKPVMI